jgi:hypothetical protein
LQIPKKIYYPIKPIKLPCRILELSRKINDFYLIRKQLINYLFRPMLLLPNKARSRVSTRLDSLKLLSLLKTLIVKFQKL